VSKFDHTLKFGKVAEGRIALYMRQRGFSVLPVYEIEKGQGKGPQVFTPTRGLIAPDMFVFKDKAYWVEAKHKTVFTWHYVTQCWTTGVDLRHYEDYLHVDEATPCPVWLTFLHSQSEPDQRDIEHGCPTECPTGLYGNRLSYLRRHEHHRSPAGNGNGGWGRSGMVYWEEADLYLIAPLCRVPDNVTLSGATP